MRRGRARNAAILFFCVSGIAGIYGIARAMVPRALHATEGPILPDIIQQQVDQHIPFDAVAGQNPGANCNPVDLELLVITDQQGRDLDYRWRIQERDGYQIECGDFYELYYRCDGHSCYQMRVVRRSEDHNHEIISEPVHVCLR